MIYDLHSHSTASDGVLTPSLLIARAEQCGVNVLALTDHDIVAGLEEAQQAADKHGIGLIPGVEISVTWQKQTIHIVGLGIDRQCQSLLNGLNHLQTIRSQRAQEIAQRLEKIGIPDALRGSEKFAPGNNITRTHFARYLVELGKARDMNDVFKHFLASGKPGYVQVEWATLQQAVQWINDAGGRAVVAHPARYKMTGTKMGRLLTDFVDCGGAGLEIINGGCGRDIIQKYAGLAKRFNLLASVGSDFHDPATPWMDLGKLQPLPRDLTPIWDGMDLNC